MKIGDLDLLREAVDSKYEPREYRACQIALMYERLRREFFNDPYTCLNRKRDKRDSRCFPHFYKLAKIEEEHRDIIPDMSLYLRAQFEITKLRAGALENNIPVPPQHLHSKMALERYRDYILQLVPPDAIGSSSTPRSDKRTMIRSLGKTATFLIKTNMDIFGENEIDWFRLMSFTRDGDYQPLFFLFVLQNLVSRYFLASSKTYPKWISTLDPDCQFELPQDLNDYSEALLSSHKAIQFGREAFGSEFTL